MISYPSGSTPVDPNPLPRVVQTPQTISTTRPNGGGLSTQTSGPQALPTFAQTQAPLDSMTTIADYMMRKRQAAAPQQMQAQMPSMAQPRDTSEVLGAAPPPPKQPVGRMRRVRLQTAIPSIMDMPGLTYRDESETQLDDGSWSLDGVHGTLAGNEIATREAYKSIPTMQNPFPGLTQMSLPSPSGDAIRAARERNG